MKNLYLLPTDQQSRLVKIKDTFFLTSTDNIPGGTFYNIYITSDEEIGEGDWCLNVNKDTIYKKDKYPMDISWKKIILSTDPELIADGVQPIDDEFLKWFVKNPSCEEVKIESWQTKGEWDLDYKIIIPQEEPKQETHICKYCDAETTQPDDECYAKPKQETLEEAAINCWAEGAWDNRDDFTDGFVEGAKWQAERMYSEEDLKLAYNEGQVSIINSTCVRTEEWFEQFKKK